MRQNVACGLSHISNRPRLAYLVIVALISMGSESSDEGQIFPTVC